ncbi:MAG: phenylpropionate dioxygenase-like ring-hydroxylating dioxygenase large terminal subunit [Arenicella sp.]|jgi:Rieske 2Fe-2S family protein
MSVTSSPPSSQKIATAVAAQQRGHSLDRIFYQDEDIYQAELDQFFLKHWIFAGHTSQIPEIGNYFNLNFDSESIIVVRSDDNQIKAHLNVCRHRGSRLCIEDSGTTKRFTCPYHAWSYRLNGELATARNMPDDFDYAENSLHSVKLELVGGLIFISLSANPPSLKAMRDDLGDMLSHLGVDRLKLAQHERYVIPANWKLALENYQECYHCAPSHQEFAKVHAMAKSPEVYEKLKSEYWAKHPHNIKFQQFNRYFELAEHGQEGYQYDRNPLLPNKLSGSKNGAAVAPFLGDLNCYDGGASELMIGPISFFLIYDDHVLGYRFLPLSKDQCACDVFWFVDENAENGRDYDLDQLTWLWDVTTQADKTIIANNQKGVDSRFYKSGRLSEMETFQQSFLDWYLEVLSPEAD